MMKNNYYFLTLPLLSLFTTNVSATIELTDNLLFSGFGSTAMSKSDNQTPLYLNRELTDDTCFDCDTTLGLQLDYQFLDHFTSSIQLVKRPQDEWSDPRIEWMYLGYNYNHLDFKAGRLRLPTFLDSEYFYVAHAYTPTHPPQEVYDGLLGVTSYDGFNVTWHGELTNDIYFSIEPHAAFTGQNKVTKGNVDYTFNINEMYGLHIELSSYNYRVFVNALYANYDMGLQFSAISPSAPAFESNSPGESITMYSFGGEYLWDVLTLRAEGYSSRDNFNWYTQAAYSLDKLTPYINYAEKDDSGATANSNHTITTGLRFDFTPSISVNLEYQKVLTDTYDPTSPFGSGQFTTPFVDPSKTDANVYTLKVNFII